MRGPALRLVAVVDVGAAHDALGVRFHVLDGGGGAGEYADELAGVCHGGGAEDGAGDEVGAVAFDLPGERGGGVRVHGRAVDEEFVFYGGDGGEGGGDGGGDGGVVAEAGEDYGGFGDDVGERGGDGGFAGGEGGLEGGGAVEGAVEDYEGVVEVAFFDEVFAHALCYVSGWNGL